jgi:MFS transporter, putative metabolite:H+ symporter
LSGERTNSWLLAPFFGPRPALPATALRTLSVLALGLFFANYDLGLVNAALPQIARGLGVAPEDTGFLLSMVRLGGAGAFLLIPLADRVGRRRAFLACLVGMSVGTFATALSQTPLQFALCQTVARMFLLTASALSVVILVEELPAEQRGGGIAFLQVLGGAGFGLGAGLYAAVDSLPFGWRALYAVGALPLLLLPFFRRSIRETARFEAARRERGAEPGGLAALWLAPLRELARTHPRRAASVGAAGVFGAIGGIAFFQYTSWFVEKVHGWAPGQYTLLFVAGGMIGLIGNVAGGRGSDRFGRRRIGVAGWFCLPVFAALFYLGPSWTLVVAWGLVVLCGSAADIVLRALATELFPTSHRATAGAWLTLVETLGWSAGLAAVGLLARAPGDLRRVIPALSVSCLFAALCLLFVPETHRRELEEIS